MRLGDTDLNTRKVVLAQEVTIKINKQCQYLQDFLGTRIARFR